MTTNSLRQIEALRFQTVGGRPPPREQILRPELAPQLTGETIRTRDGRTLLMRHIERNDIDALRRGFETLTPEEIRMRFLHPMTELPPQMAKQLCDVDPALGVALVLIDPADKSAPMIRAVARAYVDPATHVAEFGLIVHHDLAGLGLGTFMMQRLIDACRERGVVELWGDVLIENGGMLELCDHLGFARHSIFHDPGVQRVTLAL
jgi:acetyltransferase